MINKLKSLFRPNKFAASKHVIKSAFVIAGQEFFEFDTTLNLPYKRGLKFLSIYTEMDCKCDKYYMAQHIAAMDKILTGGKKIGLDELIQIKQLNNQLKERQEFVVQEDLAYKLASVVFFDATENPNDWEYKYALKKIEFWKRHEDVLSFFLREPIQRLMPFLKISGENIQTYSEVEKEMDKAHLEKISRILSPNQKSNLPNYMNRYFSQGIS